MESFQEKLRQRLLECRRTGRLNLSYLDLTDFPAGLVQQLKATAPSIQELDLRSNSLTTLPLEIAELRTLRSVKLNYNRFSSFPSVLTALPRVQIIEFTGNQLSEIDASVGDLKSVIEMDLSGNRIATIDDAFCTLDSLVSINLENNLISSLPDDFCMMKSLSRVDLSTNRLSKLPSNLSRLSNLTRLDVNSNNLVTIPPEIGRIKSLRELDVRYNELKEPMKSASEESLPKFLDFLRGEEEREKQEELERLKPVGVAGGSYTYYSLKLRESMDMHGCQLRQGQTTTHCGQNLIVFGGALVHDGHKDNEVYALNLDRMVWSKVLTQGPTPPPRDGHAAAYDPIRERLYIFGGRDAERRRLNDMYYLDVNSWAWTKVEGSEADEPSPREGASMCVGGNKLFVFAGCTKGLRYNDVFIFDMDTEQWEVPPTSGSAPSPRFNAAVCYSEEFNSLFIFGGRNTFMLCDLYALDLETLVFREILTTTSSSGNTTAGGGSGNGGGRAGRAAASSLHMPRRAHSAVMSFCKGDLYVMFGVGEMGPVHDHGLRMSFKHVEPAALSPSPSMQSAKSPGSSTSGTQRLGINTLRGEWCALNTEMSYLPNRVATFDYMTGMLFVLQEGSSVVGVPIDERHDVDPERRYGAMCLVSVDELKSASSGRGASATKSVNMKRLRISRYNEALASSAPKSYHTQTDKEKKVLDYVERYRKQYIELYTSRRPMPLTFRNEVGVEKFVCTTVRPTLMPYTELYDWETCARFLADFLEYEILEEAHSYPFCLPSPANVLHWQAGDCFDFAVVLTSLLIGAGYESYVVVGYAEEAVTVNDLSSTDCPFATYDETVIDDIDALDDKLRAMGVVTDMASIFPLGTGNGQDKAAKRGGAGGNTNTAGSNKYAVPKSVSLESAYQRDLGESKDDERNDDEVDTYFGRSTGGARRGEISGTFRSSGERPEMRLHAWVIVLAGKREVAESFFIEPSTGQKYPTSGSGASPYYGIECMFSNKNFYINMQERFIYPEPGFPYVTGISLDLSDSSCWEYVMPKEDFVPDEDGPAETETAAATTVASSSAAAAGRENEASEADGADAEGATDAAKTETPLVEDVLDMPASWVPKLSISREAFDMRCPRGERMTVYRNCTYEVFALFGECSRYSGETSRLCFYEDEHRSVLLECRETFARRKDKLLERKVRPQENTTIELFGPGSSFGLKDITVVKGVKRIMNFHLSARLDGLVSRREFFGRKMIEKFASRDDRMYHRRTKYRFNPEAAAATASEEALRSPGGLRSSSSLGQNSEPQEIMKITEKFERNPNVDADKDVWKRKFYIYRDQIKIDFHYGSGRISASGRVYAKDGVVNVVQVDPSAQSRPKDVVLLEEYQALLIREKESILSAREAEREVREILRVRAREEQPPQLEVPYFDVVRATVESDDEEDAEESATVEIDYLSTFLPKEALTPGYKLSKAEALEVREKCLRALHDRLIEREHIIQARHDEETASLAKRQTNFQRDRDQMTPMEEQEYEKACEESMFRIHILEQRIKRHEEQALQKYYDLDSTLCNDPRLSVLLVEQ